MMSDAMMTGDGLEHLLSLEEKIMQTIDLLKSTRADKEQLLRENIRLRREWEDQSETIRRLEDRLGRMDKERDTVRTRILRLVEQVDTLTQEKAEV